MDRIVARFTLEDMIKDKTPEFKHRVYKSVDRLREIMFNRDDISIETLGLIVLLEEINEKAIM